MTETPEGFLICLNVPIARTGIQKYLGKELGRRGKESHHIYDVDRQEEEVFDPRTLASFEGKPVTDGHPVEDVGPSNYVLYEKGHVQNVRRGVDEQSNLIIADLHIKDPKLISEIKNNVKREISCGYRCAFGITDSGYYQQIRIRGNHVAVVLDGRAGAAVTIKDSKVKKERDTYSMKKPLNRFMKLFAKATRDASDEELDAIVEDATNAMADLETKATDGESKTVVDAALLDSIKEVLNPVLDSIAELTKEVNELKAKDSDPNAAEVLSEEGEEKEGESAEETSETTTDSTTTLETLKPIIAKIKDKALKAELIDALSGFNSNDEDGVRVIVETVAQNAKDKKPKEVTEEERQAMWDARNPHIAKKEAK